MVRSNYDVIVVGGGPVGSVAAISAARTGARVLVLEANPEAAKRFAGEWIHPTGVAVLDRLRIGRLEGAQARTGYGFVVLPDDGSDPIELAYPGNQVALACEHSAMVEAVRASATERDEITFLTHARVLDIDDHDVTFRYQGVDTTVHAGRVIGCDGRSSLSRKAIGLAPHGDALSYMASVELTDVDLPVEGYGHVVLGGPGPVLLYRITPNLIRGCFDVPLRFDASRRNPSFLWDAFSAVLPERLREPFRKALERGPVGWAVNRFAARAVYGRDPVWLSGDAVGHFHPLTAAGLTLGFLDAERAGQLSSLSDYQLERERDSYVPELLSNALYQVFSRDDVSAAQIRSAVYRVWRKSPFERERTMRILMGQESRRSMFGAAFVRMALAALSDTTRDLLESRRLRDLPETLMSFGEWARWPAATLAGTRTRESSRSKSTSERPPVPLKVLTDLSLRRPANSIVTVDVPPSSDRGQSVEAVLSSACDALLSELRRLHERIGQDPDFTLLRRATGLVAAIDRVELGGSMKARMQLARRPMARVGMARLLEAKERDPHAVRASDFASFMIDLLSASAGERIERLEEGLRYLLSCQHSTGGFCVWPSVHTEPDFATTELCTRALALCRIQEGNGGPTRFADAEERARRFLLSSQRADGSWPASELEGSLSNTCSAVRALVSLSEVPSSPALRRATRFLVAQQHEGGLWRERSDERASSALLTARVLSALLTAPGPHWGIVERAISPLTHLLSRELLPALVEGEESLAPVCATVVHALANYESARKNRPLPEASDAKGGDDWSYCRASLMEVSRTFSKPIQMLPGDLEVAVTCGYLLCRIADTIEDHPNVPREKKDMLFARFLDVLERGAPPRGLSLAFDEIAGKDAELDLARNLSRVMRVFWGLPENMQRIVTRWVAEMSRGMNLYTHREPGEDGFTALYTIEDLERYCYYVAGTVGHMLTELFAEVIGGDLPPEMLTELRHHSEAFGMGLQLVNILKDVTDDRERRWSFIPRSACERVGIDIESLTLPQVRPLAHEAVAPIFDVAERRLERALTYALSIPPEQKGIRLFCLLPLWMAALTLVHGRGNDAMFVVGQEVKISREQVDRVIAECVTNVGNDEVLRARYRTLWVRGGTQEAGVVIR